MFEKLKGEKVSAVDNTSLIKDYEKSVSMIILFAIDSMSFEVGINNVIRVLRGSQNIFITEHKLYDNPVYGALCHFSKKELTLAVKTLAVKGYIETHEVVNAYNVVSLTPKGHLFLYGNKELNAEFLSPMIESEIIRLDENEISLLKKLSDFRFSLTEKDGLKTYEICSDKTLIELVKTKPQSQAEFKTDDESFNSKYLKLFIEKIKTTG